MYTPLYKYTLKDPLMIKQLRNFSTPSKEKFTIFESPQAGLQKWLTPLTSRPSPTAGLKMTNPFIMKFLFIHATD